MEIASRTNMPGVEVRPDSGMEMMPMMSAGRVAPFMRTWQRTDRPSHTTRLMTSGTMLAKESTR